MFRCFYLIYFLLSICKTASSNSVQNKAIVLIGGKYSSDSIEFFYPDDPSKNTISNRVLLMARSEMVAGIINNEILFGAGFNLIVGFLNSTEIYDPTTGQVTPGPTMTINRDDPAGTYINNTLYVCGGWFANHPLNNCEKLESDHFVKIPPMQKARFGLAMVAIGNKVYAIGGGVDNQENFTDIVEVFDTTTNHWTTIKSMPVKKMWMSAAVLDRFIYECGGCSGKNCEWNEPYAKPLNSCNRFDPKNNQWSPVANMTHARMGHSMVALDGKLVVLGGELEKTVEIYEPKTNKWSLIETKLFEMRAYSGTVLL